MTMITGLTHSTLDIFVPSVIQPSQNIPSPRARLFKKKGQAPHRCRGRGSRGRGVLNTGHSNLNTLKPSGLVNSLTTHAVKLFQDCSTVHNYAKTNSTETNLLCDGALDVPSCVSTSIPDSGKAVDILAVFPGNRGNTPFSWGNLLLHH